jgi:hypothetical protein
MMLNMTRVSVGLVSAMLLGALFSSPADAQSPRRQQGGAHWQQPGYSSGVTKWPTNTPSQYVVCWNGCNSPNAIVMGADPDPFIRQQILRDGGAFFGGGDR